MLTPKKVLVSAIPCAITGYIFGTVFRELFCSSFDCQDFFDYSGQFLFLFSVILIVINFSLIFLHKEIFTSWWKFARIYIPVSAILTILSGSGSGGGYIGLTSDYESTAWFMAGLFFIISLALIIYKSIKLRGKHNQ
ncbi:hypothetical protein L6249_01830 [Candidatus Parcubacteria bacterium]|nr:hypothetical protein [Candidatus Parcubacteria bacterium]